MKKNQYSKELIAGGSSIENMSLYELCRWAALIEGVEIITEKAKSRKKSMKHIVIPTLDLYDFVDRKSDEYVEKYSN